MNRHHGTVRVVFLRMLASLLVLLIAFFLPAFLAVAQNPAGTSIRIVDDRGHAQFFSHPPLRIASLLPSLTESVCALGQCHRLAGVDRYSNFPASVRLLPVLGGGLDPHIEAIVALRPDVVLLAPSALRAVVRLESLGLRVVALEPKTHSDVRRVLQTLGLLMAVPQSTGADRVWQAIDTEMAAAARTLRVSAKASRIYFAVGSSGYAASEASFIGETLQRLGVNNVVPAALGPFPKLNPEFVVQANPDIWMGSSTGALLATPYPGWRSIRAIKEQRICRFDAGQTDVLVRAGPRMAEAAWLMAACIEKFSVAKPLPADAAR